MTADAAPDPAEPDPRPPGPRTPRPPSLLDALIPVVALIFLIGLTVALFGTDATSGPLQVALFTSAVVAALVAFKNGHSTAKVRDAAVGGITSAMSAVFILLAVGALIGAWNMAGTIPTVVYYGVGLLNVTWFYPVTAIICGVVGLTIGSSWTTAATLGVAFVALAPLLGANPAITAGAVISGAYFGDKMTPISETTVLVPSMVGGVTTQEHVGAMIWTSGPAILLALVGFVILGVVTPTTRGRVRPGAGAGGPRRRVLDLAAQPAAADHAGRLLAAPRAALPVDLRERALRRRSWPASRRRRWSRPSSTGRVPDRSRRRSWASIRSSPTASCRTAANATIDALFSRGGMDSMLTTIWLVLGALSYAAIMEDAGFLERLIRPVLARAHSAGRLIASVILTCLGLNIIAGDQYVAIVMPSRIYRLEFAKRGLAPRMLSRAVEDSGTVTSPLIPWNSCGAYMAGVLGVATIAYLPYCFFNLAEPDHLAHLRLHRVPHRAHPADRDHRSPPVSALPDDPEP